ncbi:unnamed protein product, partial [Staurois parvus]
SRRVPTQFWSSGRTVRGEEFVTLPRLHPDSQCLPRSAGRIIRVLTFGAGRPRGGRGAARPAHRRAALNLPGEPRLADPLSYGNPIACHLVGSVLRSRSKGEKEPHC